MLGSALGVASKAGADLSAWAIIGPPVAVGILAYGLQRTAPRAQTGGGARVSYELDHLRVLESEAIHVMREVAAEFERPVLLFSGGKDSIVLLRLAEKAFRPGRFPFPLMHVDREAQCRPCLRRMKANSPVCLRTIHKPLKTCQNATAPKPRPGPRGRLCC